MLFKQCQKGTLAHEIITLSDLSLFKTGLDTPAKGNWLRGRSGYKLEYSPNAQLLKFKMDISRNWSRNLYFYANTKAFIDLSKDHFPICAIHVNVHNIRNHWLCLLLDYSNLDRKSNSTYLPDGTKSCY